MRYILRKLLRVFIYMAVLFLLAWGTVVLLSPSRTNFRQGAKGRTNSVLSTNGTLPGNHLQERRFAAGELAEYTLRFAKAPIGEGVFKVEPRDTVDAPWRFSLRLTAMGGAFGYEANATLDSDFRRTLAYQNTEVIPLRGKRTVRLVFDDSNGTTVRRSLNGGEPGAPIALPNSYYDPLSMIYAFREMNFDAGREVKWTVTDGKSSYVMSARVKNRENIRIGQDTFRTFLVEPDLGNFRGIFNQGKGAQLQIWFSDDAHTVPLRLRFKSPIGEIVAENKNYIRPAPPRRQ